MRDLVVWLCLLTALAVLLTCCVALVRIRQILLFVVVAWLTGCYSVFLFLYILYS